jgi:hypothetical protein
MERRKKERCSNFGMFQRDNHRGPRVQCCHTCRARVHPDANETKGGKCALRHFKPSVMLVLERGARLFGLTWNRPSWLRYFVGSSAILDEYWDRSIPKTGYPNSFHSHVIQCYITSRLRCAALKRGASDLISAHPDSKICMCFPVP